MRTVSKSATFLATESVNSAPFKRGETEVQIFWQRKAQNSSPILRCTFLARRSAKLIANFSATMVTSLPSFSLSLSLCISLSHRMYLTHNIGSASALPIISLSLRLHASYSHLGPMRVKRKHRWRCTCFREVSSLTRFQRTGDGRVHRLLGTSMKANIFLQGGRAQCIRPCCWGRRSATSQPDEWQVTSAS